MLTFSWSFRARVVDRRLVEAEEVGPEVVTGFATGVAKWEVSNITGVLVFLSVWGCFVVVVVVTCKEEGEVASSFK